MRKLYVLILLVSVTFFAGCDDLKSVFDFGEKSVGAYSRQRRPTDVQKALFYEVTASLGDRVEYEPMNVGVQVVAGTNYRYFCKGREKMSDGKTQKIYAEIIIHQPLPGQGEPRIISISRQKR